MCGFDEGFSMMALISALRVLVEAKPCLDQPDQTTLFEFMSDRCPYIKR